MIKCNICSEFFTEETFSGHPYKIHKIKLEDYFKKYYNKKDLFTDEKLIFKSVSQYLSSDFLNKNNLRAWVKAANKDDVKSYCIKWLENRRELKEIRFAPSQVELKTLVFPTIKYLDELFREEGGYYQVCENLGYFLRHLKIDKNLILRNNFEYSEKLRIIKDTREGKPLIFSCLSETNTLNWGDYALSDEELSSKVRIERKSLSDFIGTLSKNYERFCREIDKCDNEKGYLIILVEEKFNNLLGFNFLPHISKRVKASPEFICHRMRELCQNYECIQFLLVDGRREAARIGMRIFQLGYQVKNLDMQLVYDLGLLN